MGVDLQNSKVVVFLALVKLREGFEWSIRNRVVAANMGYGFATFKFLQGLFIQ